MRRSARRAGRASRSAGLRIVAGSLKGRRIAAPCVGGVRPTSEKVREAMFDILGRSVEDGRVLDAFAGSGANGCEAISRGAREVVFVESESPVVAVLRANVEALGIEDRCRILVGDAESFAARLRDLAPFDLILADPPYGTDLGSRFCRLVAENCLLAPRGRLVLEGPSRAGPGPTEDGLRNVRAAVYGDTRLDFYEPWEP